MKKSLFCIALLGCTFANAQNTWNGSSISTSTTNGQVTIGTATPQSNYGLTVKTTSLNNGIYNEVNRSTTSAQTGIFNNVNLNGSGPKNGFTSFFGSNSSATSFGCNFMTGGAGNGNRFGISSIVLGGAYTEVGVYSSVGIMSGPAWFNSQLPSADRSGYFIGAFEVVAANDAEKIFIVNQRNFSNAGYGTDVFRIYGDGKVYATEINVKLASQFPDYVFASNYNLMSINDLRSYINLNHHLPNIPSAEDVSEAGLNLGEMNVKLVEKVEELTLYIIQQQEQIDSLKEEIEKLK